MFSRQSVIGACGSELLIKSHFRTSISTQKEKRKKEKLSFRTCSHNLCLSDLVKLKLARTVWLNKRPAVEISLSILSSIYTTDSVALNQYQVTSSIHIFFPSLSKDGFESHALFVHLFSCIYCNSMALSLTSFESIYLLPLIGFLFFFFFWQTLIGFLNLSKSLSFFVGFI